MEQLSSLIHRGALWVLAQFVLLVPVVALPRFQHGKSDSVWTVLGYVLIATGAVLATCACLNLGRSLTPLPTPSGSFALKTSGAYRWIRHPIYSGILLATVGILCVSPTWGQAVLTLATLLFFSAKARVEERWLRQANPHYAEYAARTWRFLPFIL